jgi:hypothetical protein
VTIYAMSIHDAKETALANSGEIFNDQVSVLVRFGDLRYEALSGIKTDSINNFSFT